MRKIFNWQTNRSLNFHYWISHFALNGRARIGPWIPLCNDEYKNVKSPRSRWRGRMRFRWKFSTSALLKNVVTLNSLKVTVKKLRAENGAARIQPWSSENYSRHPKFPNLPRFVRQRRQRRLQSLWGYVRYPRIVVRMIVYVESNVIFYISTLNATIY